LTTHPHLALRLRKE